MDLSTANSRLRSLYVVHPLTANARAVIAIMDINPPVRNPFHPNTESGSATNCARSADSRSTSGGPDSATDNRSRTCSSVDSPASSRSIQSSLMTSDAVGAATASTSLTLLRSAINMGDRAVPKVGKKSTKP